MSDSPSPWPWDQISQIFRLFGKQEVKTPLSLIFKVVPYLTVSYVAVLWAPDVPASMKFNLIIAVSSVFFAFCFLVCAFAWFRPTHLVYGERGHRAERAMELEFGTNRKVQSAIEIEDEIPESNKDQLPPPDEKDEGKP